MKPPAATMVLAVLGAIFTASIAKAVVYGTNGPLPAPPPPEGQKGQKVAGQTQTRTPAPLNPLTPSTYKIPDGWIVVPPAYQTPELRKATTDISKLGGAAGTTYPFVVENVKYAAVVAPGGLLLLREA